MAKEHIFLTEPSHFGQKGDRVAVRSVWLLTSAAGATHSSPIVHGAATVVLRPSRLLILKNPRDVLSPLLRDRQQGCDAIADAFFNRHAPNAEAQRPL